MRVVLFGATGMIGQGVLRECLLDARVTRVLSVGRAPSGRTHAKLADLVLRDLGDYAAVEERLRGFDACFYCLGISSAGLAEAEYRGITVDLTLAAAKALLRANPRLRFNFISGAGADGTERGRTMWARVKGKTENALLRMPFKAAFMFRPAYIQPLDGIRSKTRLYQSLYTVVWPLYPVLKRVFPRYVTNTRNVGRAMIAVAAGGYPQRILESEGINGLAETTA